MRFRRFWVVLRPKLDSTLEKLIFDVDFRTLEIKIKTGLDDNQIHALFTERSEAEAEAQRIWNAFVVYRNALGG